MSIQTINIEVGMPTCDAAIIRLKLELTTLRRMGIDTVKIIHGYGSTGIGGAIRVKARECLRKMQTEGRIKSFCHGEDFGPFEASGRRAVELRPALRCDRDWARGNDGITIVIL